ncbi:MAG TPA: SRPBCC domain-containing protein [Noviherbaspirillum sp.]|nr:SRPBCC domain-containing protein [Noviherbaspirillum sp.]
MKANDGLVLRLERFLPFPRAVVYRALTEPGELVKWWGPRGFSVPAIAFNPQVGGRFRITMQPPDGDAFHLSGTFREVDPPARLAYTFQWTPPDPDDRETLAALSLEERDGGTELVLTHSGFATEQRRALHEAGWTESLDRLEQALSARHIERSFSSRLAPSSERPPPGSGSGDL